VAIDKCHFSLFLTQPVTFISQGDLFLLSLLCKPAFVYKLDYLWQFIGIEPNAVLLAKIDNNSRGTREIAAVHQLAAVGAGNVGYRGRMSMRMGIAADKAEHGLLLFLVCADTLKRIDIGPEAAALAAFADRHRIDLKHLQAGFASRAVTGILFVDHDRGRCPCPAVSAELCPEKHQAETRCTADGF
jgi:hypothetical protein